MRQQVIHRIPTGFPQAPRLGRLDALRPPRLHSRSASNGAGGVAARTGLLRGDPAARCIVILTDDELRRGWRVGDILRTAKSSDRALVLDGRSVVFLSGGRR